MKRIVDQEWFSNIKRPSRYLGQEVNALRKDSDRTEVTFALCFPDIYDVGMSHLGLRILYHVLNSQPWLAAERAFAPWVDLEEAMRSAGIPLSSLESNRPLAEFDLVGFSLQHELCYTNVLNMLDLAAIPLWTRQRRNDHPLVIAGGPACFNPEPVADIFDVVVIGDAEEAALSICSVIRKTKVTENWNREKLLAELRHIPGVYIPSLFRVLYRPDGPVEAVEPVIRDYQVVRKAVVPHLDDFTQPGSPVVPFTALVHDRLTVEISRGCTRGCRFCQAGMIYRPVRERHPEAVLNHAKEALRNTGYEDLSLLSLSCGDYRCLEPLIKVLMDTFEEDRTCLSLPSLRIDTLNPSWMQQIKRVRKTGFTLAPEAGNDRMRRIINKGLSHEDILRMARQVFDAGWNLIKLYFMIGLPGEEEKDIEDMISLVREVALLGGKKGGKAKVNASVASFVPKSHTPFMWASQISPEESWGRIDFVKRGLRGSRVRVKWNSPDLSWLEGIFSRGDRRLTPSLVKAWRMGARFDAWEELYQKDVWEKAFSQEGIDPGFYLYRERPEDEIFPWDHIRSGVTKRYLRQEWNKALREALTGDCREGCLECGVCDHRITDPVIVTSWTHEGEAKIRSSHKTGKKNRYRLTFQKLSLARFLGHLELVRVFIRAFKRAGIRFDYSKGFHPMPKISFASALPVGIESLAETMDIEILDKISPRSLLEIVNTQLPEGIVISQVRQLSEGDKKPCIRESRFRIILDDLAADVEALEQFLQSDRYPVLKKNPKGEKEIDARPLVKSMEILSPNCIGMSLRHVSGPEVKAAEIVGAVFSLNKAQMAGVRIVKTGQVIE